MKKVQKKCIYAVRRCKRLSIVAIMFLFAIGAGLPAVPAPIHDFETKAAAAVKVLNRYRDSFEIYAKLGGVSPRLMRSIVFPEVMRYSRLRDGIETESLRMLYVQFGAAYADFSVGQFQMKPSFAETIEKRAYQELPADLYHRLFPAYTSSQPADIRLERVERLLDTHWQLRYLAAFTALCNRRFKYRVFREEEEQMQWYALLYNGGIQVPASWILKRMKAHNRYLAEGMPGHQFRYAALAAWYYRMHRT